MDNRTKKRALQLFAQEKPFHTRIGGYKFTFEFDNINVYVTPQGGKKLRETAKIRKEYAPQLKQALEWAIELKEALQSWGIYYGF